MFEFYLILLGLKSHRQHTTSGQIIALCAGYVIFVVYVSGTVLQVRCVFYCKIITTMTSSDPVLSQQTRPMSCLRFTSNMNPCKSTKRDSFDIFVVVPYRIWIGTVDELSLCCTKLYRPQICSTS